MPSLYIDITELANWTGRITGVPRVMNELASRFTEMPDIVFVRWNAYRQDLEAIPYIPVDNTPAAATDPKIVAKDRLHIIKIVIRKSRFASRSVEVTLTRVRAAQSRYRELRRPRTGIQLEPGDKVVVLADWHGSDPNFITYLKARRKEGTRIYQFSYDLLPLVTPQYSGHSTETFRRYVKSIYPICERIITISEHTKKDIGEWLKEHKLRVPPVSVVRLGDDFTINQAVKPKSKQLKKIVEEAFILSVGTVEARKNHTLLYYAYKRAYELDINLPPVVIVGRPGWLAGDIMRIMSTDPQITHKFIFATNVSDNELAWLYEHCQYTVYMSFYEGWGLPVAESIAHGVPCLSTNTSSVPEIAGDIIRYFSPAAPDELLALMQEMSDPSKRMAAKDALKMYVPTSWNATYKLVKETIGV